MRMTIHNARANKLGAFTPKHNDRNFDVSHADHIDPERMPGNIYWNWTGKNISFEDAEKEFYELHCREHLDAVNRRYREQRHPERVRDMDAYRTARQTCPEETLLMIGNKNEYLPPRFFPWLRRSPHVRARARGQTTPLRYIRAKITKITQDFQISTI